MEMRGHHESIVIGDTFHEIEHYTNPSKTLALLGAMFKSHGAKFLNELLQRLEDSSL